VRHTCLVAQAFLPVRRVPPMSVASTPTESELGELDGF
jgi:hypothetical protein